MIINKSVKKGRAASFPCECGTSLREVLYEWLNTKAACPNRVNASLSRFLEQFFKGTEGFVHDLLISLVRGHEVCSVEQRVAHQLCGAAEIVQSVKVDIGGIENNVKHRLAVGISGNLALESYVIDRGTNRLNGEIFHHFRDKTGAFDIGLDQRDRNIGMRVGLV